MVADGKQTTALDGNKDKILTCLDEVAILRGSDTLSSQPGAPTTNGLIKDIGNLIPGAVLRLDSTTWKWDSSRTIYTPNMAKTVADSSTGTFSDTAAVKTAVRDYGRKPNGAKRDPANTHYRVHKAYRRFARKVRKSC